jgi:hypothetical protein
MLPPVDKYWHLICHNCAECRIFYSYDVSLLPNPIILSIVVQIKMFINYHRQLNLHQHQQQQKDKQKKILLTSFTKQATLTRRSTVLSSPSVSIPWPNHSGESQRSKQEEKEGCHFVQQNYTHVNGP